MRKTIFIALFLFLMILGNGLNDEIEIEDVPNIQPEKNGKVKRNSQTITSINEQQKNKIKILTCMLFLEKYISKNQNEILKIGLQFKNQKKFQDKINAMILNKCFRSINSEEALRISTKGLEYIDSLFNEYTQVNIRILDNDE